MSLFHRRYGGQPWIVPTNVTTGAFRHSAFGQDGRLYIGSQDNTGIWVLDNDGIIKQTNITIGSNYTPTDAKLDGKMLIVSNGAGFWYLDNDNIIKQITNIVDYPSNAPITWDMSFFFSGAFLRSDGYVYVFGGSGVYRFRGFNTLESMGLSGAGGWHGGVLGNDGSVYLTRSVNGAGVVRVEPSGLISSPAYPSGSVNHASFSPDYQLYEYGVYDTQSVGLRLLNNNGTFEQTNITSSGFDLIVRDKNHKTYFFRTRNFAIGATTGNDRGIWMIDEIDGIVKQVDNGSHVVSFGKIGQDKRLYFGSNIMPVAYQSPGIRYMTKPGFFVKTNKSEGLFFDAAMGQDNKLYFFSTSGTHGNQGIWRLELR